MPSDRGFPVGEAEEETDLSRARALGAALRVCICPEGMRSAWSQSARHSGGSPVNEGESEEREREISRPDQSPNIVGY